MARLVGEDCDVVAELAAGDTVVGRGPLLKVMDKRVSRSHAVLEWGNGILRLCPKHSNPCFLRPDGRSEFTALVKDEWVELHHGDQISLLPDSLRYTVELETSQNSQVGEEREADLRKDRDQKPAAITQEIGKGQEASAAAVKEKRSGGVGGTGRRRVLPSWMSGCSALPLAGPSHQTSSRSSCGASSSKPPVKRKRKLSPSPSPDDDRPQHSTPLPQEAVASDPQSVSSESAISLPPCPYGAACYRKNPTHFREYSHSTADDRPLCPYGSACYRKNPDHRKQFQHSGLPAERPAATKATRQTRSKRNTKRVSVLAGESDDSEGPNTYDYTDSFIDDEGVSSGSTSYGGESEDGEWAPPTESGGGGGEEEEEEVGGLVEEAKNFISNKKMWQP